MASFNRAILIGNLTRDPELKDVGNGRLCRMSIAVNHQYKNRQTNAMVQEVCYMDIEVWGPQAESCGQYLQKGKSILVDGRIKLDSWKDAAGQARSKHSVVADRVVFLSSNQAAEFGTAENSFEESREVTPTSEVKAKKAPRSAKASDAMSDVVFKDEQPFEDDLPF